MKHNGKSIHRLKSNPAEKALHDAWQAENDEGHILEYLLGDDNRRGDVSERDAMVAATVIQWLGSPVGHNFLQRVMSSNDIDETRPTNNK